MKATIKTEKEVELKHVLVQAEVRYWEDATINGVDDEDGTLTPCREGENWCPVIEIDTGKILNWPDGKKASVHFKVCDCCAYEIIDSEGNTVIKKDGYVPSFLCPKESGYGDYIIMDISENGQIDKWKFKLEKDED